MRRLAPRLGARSRDVNRISGAGSQSTIRSRLPALKGTVSPWLGQYVAEIRIPDDVVVRIEQTGRDHSHYTSWAEADDLLSWVVSVTPIQPVH